MWHWIVPGSIGAVIGSGATEAFRWMYPSRKEWTAARQAKTTKEIDRRVIEALENRTLWKGPRPITGSGDVAVRADELAGVLSLSEEDVADSLDRLESQDRVENAGGEMSDPRSRWFSTRRF